MPTVTVVVCSVRSTSGRLVWAVFVVTLVAGTLDVMLPTSHSALASSLPIFTSTCVRRAMPYPIPSHPIVTFGDSITEDYGATNKCLPRELRPILPAWAHRVYTGDTSYPGDLERLLHTSVLNYGVGGELTGDGLPRLRSLLRSVRPATVIILEGINDLWSGRSAADIREIYSPWLGTVQAIGARPIIPTVLPTDRPIFPGVRSKVNALNAATRATAKQQGVQVIDAASRYLVHHPLSALYRHGDGWEDGVHPNDAGYRLLADLVSQVIRSR